MAGDTHLPRAKLLEHMGLRPMYRAEHMRYVAHLVSLL